MLSSLSNPTLLLSRKPDTLPLFSLHHQFSLHNLDHHQSFSPTTQRLHLLRLHLCQCCPSLTHNNFSPSLTLSSTLPLPNQLITLHLLAPLIIGSTIVNANSLLEKQGQHLRYDMCIPCLEDVYNWCAYYTFFTHFPK